MLSDPNKFLPHTPHPERSPLRFCHVLKTHHFVRAPSPTAHPLARVTSCKSGIQLLRRIVKRFQGGLVFKAHRRFNHAFLGSRVIKKKERKCVVHVTSCKHTVSCLFAVRVTVKRRLRTAGRSERSFVPLLKTRPFVLATSSQHTCSRLSPPENARVRSPSRSGAKTV